MRSIDQNRGECELIRNLKGLLMNFTVRNLDYQTTCFPHEVTLEFTVMGQVFQPLDGSHRPRSAPFD